jgi:hypothetical protein
MPIIVVWPIRLSALSPGAELVGQYRIRPVWEVLPGIAPTGRDKPARRRFSVRRGKKRLEFVFGPEIQWNPASDVIAVPDNYWPPEWQRVGIPVTLSVVERIPFGAEVSRCRRVKP